MSESSPKLLDLIPKNKEWVVHGEKKEAKKGSSCDHENNKLELRLGLPGDDSWCSQNKSFKEKNESLLSLNHHKQGFNPWQTSSTASQSQFLPPHHYQTCPKGLSVMVKESSQPCCTSIADLQKSAEKKAFAPASVNRAVPNSAQKRSAPAPVVGWPPIRSFRKNLASSSSAKPVSQLQSAIENKPSNEKPTAENSHKGLFVKINMDGVPIGRKVDLNAYDNYEKLSSSVDHLFRGLLAAQRDCCDGMMDNKEEEEKPITGLLDGSGEYTLVYEDNEGDRMLVGDVPWHMFVSTVKRLRVLKSSDLTSLSRGGSKAGKMMVENASK